MYFSLHQLFSTAMVVLLTLTGCGTEAGESAAVSVSPAGDAAVPVPAEEEPAAEPLSLTVTVGDAVYTAALADNETAQALAERLPLTVDMRELNGNEKYFYLDGSLPTAVTQPGQIQAGDLMLYGDDCLVLFYESFASGYSYTPLGRLDDPTGLAEAVGSGSVTVTFAWAD